MIIEKNKLLDTLTQITLHLDTYNVELPSGWTITIMYDNEISASVLINVVLKYKDVVSVPLLVSNFFEFAINLHLIKSSLNDTGSIEELFNNLNKFTIFSKTDTAKLSEHMGIPATSLTWDDFK